MKQNKIYSLLGLAMRGRNLVSGEFQTEDAVKKGSAMLVIVAEDASANTKKLFHDKCSYYEVPDRKSTRLNSSHVSESRMPSSA